MLEEQSDASPCIVKGLERDMELHSAVSVWPSEPEIGLMQRAVTPAVVGLGLRFQSIPAGAVEPCMGGAVTSARDNVSCQESADHSQNKMYLCQDG